MVKEKQVKLNFKDIYWIMVEKNKIFYDIFPCVYDKKNQVLTDVLHKQQLSVHINEKMKDSPNFKVLFPESDLKVISNHGKFLGFFTGYEMVKMINSLTREESYPVCYEKKDVSPTFVRFKYLWYLNDLIFSSKDEIRQTEMFKRGAKRVALSEAILFLGERGLGD